MTTDFPRPVVPQSRRQPVVHGEESGAAVCVGERVRDCHLTLQRRIGRLELDHFDNLLVVTSSPQCRRYRKPMRDAGISTENLHYLAGSR